MPRPKGFLVDGRFLKAQRSNAGMTQDELAAHCGLTRSVIQKAERGGPLSSSTIRALALAVGCGEEALVVPEEWDRSLGGRAAGSLRPEVASKIGSVWGQSREMLYRMPLPLFQTLALRNFARVLPAFSPCSQEGTAHLLHLAAAVELGTKFLAAKLSGHPLPDLGELSRGADACYHAVGYTRADHYEDDLHAADAAFAVATAGARTLDSLVTSCSSTGDNANRWRSTESAAMANHAAGHASVFLTVDDAFVRSATLDIHDLRNHDPVGILMLPLWEGGEIPAALKVFMNRLINRACFPQETIVLWNRWVRHGFQS